MNKYQEALDFIVKNSCPQKTTCGECVMNKVCNSEAKQRIDVLQELIEKATPNKPVKSWIFEDVKKAKTKGIPNFKTFRCPVCGVIVNDKSPVTNKQNKLYCDRCGQALDWSEEE